MVACYFERRNLPLAMTPRKLFAGLIPVNSSSWASRRDSLAERIKTLIHQPAPTAMKFKATSSPFFNGKTIAL